MVYLIKTRHTGVLYVLSFIAIYIPSSQLKKDGYIIHYVTGHASF